MERKRLLNILNSLGSEKIYDLVVSSYLTLRIILI